MSLLRHPVNVALSLHLMEHIKKPAITVPLRHCRHIGKIIDMIWIVTMLLDEGVDLQCGGGFEPPCEDECPGAAARPRG